MWCQPPRWRNAFSSGRFQYPFMTVPPRAAISPTSPTGTSWSSSSTMRTSTSGDGRPCVPCRADREAVERHHADGLGLAVAAGASRPTRSCRGLTIASHSAAARRAAQAREVVGGVRVHLEDLVEHRPDEERAGAALGLDRSGRAARRRRAARTRWSRRPRTWRACASACRDGTSARCSGTRRRRSCP